MKALAVLLVAAGIVAALTLPAMADGSGDVEATITPKLIAISVNPSSVDYGSHQPGENNLLPSPDHFTAKNEGTVAERFLIKGADTEDWTLTVGSADVDKYVHRFTTAPGGTFQPLGPDNQNLSPSVAASPTPGTIDVYLQLDMPSSTAITTQQHAFVTVTAMDAALPFP